MKVSKNGMTYEGTPEEIKKFYDLMGDDFTEEAEEDTTTSEQDLKVGDRVKTLADGQFYDIEAGVVAEVVDIRYDDDDPYNIEVIGDDGENDYFRPQDLELVTEEETPEFKVGDSVRVSVEGTPKYSWGKVKNGDIGVIKRIEDDFIKVDFPSQSFWTALPSELVPLTDEEVEQAKQEYVFTKAGRKPGEFKKGDIVSDGTGGAIFTVLSGYEIETGSVRFPEMIRRNIDEVKLVAPVEARVDV